MVDLSVNLCGMQMDNPVVPASGTFGFARNSGDFMILISSASFHSREQQGMPAWKSYTPYC